MMNYETFGRAHITHQIAKPEPDLAPADDWTGQHLIRAPKRAQPPEPPKSGKPARMNFTKRRKMIAEMHAGGASMDEMADRADKPKDIIYADLKALGITPPKVERKQIGDEDKAREVFHAFCKRHNIAQKKFRDTKRVVAGMADNRARCLVEMKEASGASVRLLATVTGLQEQTIRMALRRMRSRVHNHEAQA